MKKQILCYLLLSICISAVPLHAAPVLTGLNKIKLFSGSWKTEIAHFSTQFSKAGRVSGILRNDCWRSGNYYVCNQHLNGKPKELLVFTYESKDRTYTVYPIRTGRGPIKPGKLIIHGNIWIYPWTRNHKGRTVYFHIINVFTALDTIEYREEYSFDQSHWYPIAQGYEKKIVSLSTHTR